MPLSASTILTAAAALAAVLCAILAAAHLLQRTGFARAGGQRLRLLETLALDRVRRLHLVSCDGRELLVLAGPSGDARIEWLPPAGGRVAEGAKP